MATVLGTRTTLNTTTTNKMRDVESMMKWIRPFQTPITQYFVGDKRRQEVTFGDRSKFEWYEDEDLSRSTTLPSGISSGSTTKTGVSVGANIFRVNDIVFFPSTRQTARVTVVTTGSSTIDLILVSSGTFSAVASGATVKNLRSAHADNYSRQSSATTTETLKTGYCQIGLEALSMTGRQQASKPYTGKDWAYQVKKKLEEMKRYVEDMFLYNPAATDDSSNDITYSAGAVGAITTNDITYTGSVDDSELVDFLEVVMAKGSPERYMYCGSKYMKDIDAFLKDVFTHNTNDFIKSYGGVTTAKNNPEFLTYKSPFGLVHFVWHPLMTNEYAYNALCLDLEQVKMRFMADDEIGSRKFRIEKDVQDNGAGNKHDQMLSDIGFQFCGEASYHGWHRKA